MIIAIAGAAADATGAIDVAGSARIEDGFGNAGACAPNIAGTRYEFFGFAAEPCGRLTGLRIGKSL